MVKKWLKPWGGHHGIGALIVVMLSHYVLDAAGLVIPLVWGVYLGREATCAQLRARDIPLSSTFEWWKPKHWEIWDLVTPFLMTSAFAVYALYISPIYS